MQHMLTGIMQNCNKGGRHNEGSKVILFYGLLAVLTGISDIVFYVKTEQYMGVGPTISLVSGILSILSGIMLFLYPGVGKWAMAIFFPMWFIAHCISRLSHLNFMRVLAGTGYYILTLD